MTEVWSPLFMLSKRLVDAGHALIASAFGKIVNHDTIPRIEDFLGRILKWSGIHRYRCRPLLCTEARAKDDPIFGESSFASVFPSPGCAVSDTLFGLDRPQLTTREAAGVALNFLNDDEAAFNCLSMPEHPFSENVRRLNDRFFDKRPTLFSALRIPRNDPLIPALDAAVDAFRWEDYDLVPSLVHTVRRLNLSALTKYAGRLLREGAEHDCRGHLRRPRGQLRLGLRPHLPQSGLC
jgi:hypothetical protein